MKTAKWERVLCLAAILGLALAGCAQSGLTVNEWFTHAQLSTMDISKGDILVREGIQKNDQGDFEDALGKWGEAVSFFQNTGNLKKLANVYLLLGSAYLQANHYDESFKHLRQAMEIGEKTGDPHAMVGSLLGLAQIYQKLGDGKKAIDCGSRALEFAKKRGDRKEEARVLETLGDTFRAQGQPYLSVEHYQKALDISRGAADPLGIQSGLSGLGPAMESQGRYREALGYFQEALRMARERNDLPAVIGILNQVGNCQAKLGHWEKALSSFQEGLSLGTAMDVYFPEDILYAHFGIASAREKRGDFLGAARHYRAAIAEIEAIRGKLGSGEHRSAFLEEKIVVYEKLIDLLLQKNKQARESEGATLREFKGYGETRVEAAFFFAESTKARSFLEALARGKQEIMSGRIPGEIARREKALTARLSSLYAGRVQGAGEKTKGPGYYRREIEKGRKELEEFIRILRRDYPDYAAIRYPEPVTIRNLPLKGNEVLLAYKVNPNATYLWVIQKNKETRMLTLPIGREELAKKVHEFREPLENGRSLDDSDLGKGEELFRILLAQGLQGLDEKANLIIIPDGPLSLLPFEALIVEVPGPNGTHSISGPVRYEGIQFAGDRYRITYSPSASILAVLRRAQPSGTTARSLFALGDPIYDEADSRYQGILARRGTVSRPALSPRAGGPRLRDVAAENGFSIPRLPETREEVLGIGQLFPTGEKIIKLDQEASETEIKKTNLRDYGHIHFATHGILSGDIPYIQEPSLVLSLAGDPDNDGFLRMSEILGLRLNADIVVLSACKTALGRVVAGEGIVGLSRAFMLTGAKSVIVSLWSVESESTAVLMRMFYAHLRAGKTKEEALRLAKQELRGGVFGSHRERKIEVVPRKGKVESSSAHPFFWAPFILMGEWE